MEIFVRNIPHQASEKNLERYFQKEFQPFSINDFSCRKLKRQGCAIMTVLDAQKAQRFLDVYGSASPDSSVPLLKYMDKTLLCSPSKFKPDDMLLQTLRKDAKDKGKQPHFKAPASGSAENFKRDFEYTLLQCGFWDYQGCDLVFISQVIRNETGSIMFGKKNMALVAHSNSTTDMTYRLDVPYSIVQSITIGSFQDPSLTITLSEAPRVYQQSMTDLGSIQSLLNALGLDLESEVRSKRRRSTSLGGRHERIIGSCFVYRILISDPGQIRFIGLLLRNCREMPPSIPWPTSVVASRSMYETELNFFTSTLCDRYHSLQFSLQFQVQRLVQNGYLTSARVLELLPHILQLVRHSGNFLAVEALRKLSRQLPFAGPDVDGKVFAIENIGKLLRETTKTSKQELSYRLSFTREHPHIGLVHKALVTPAGIYLEGPEPETKNRVLRAYPEQADHFIRVTFSDEDGERMSFDPNASLEEIFHSRFKDILEGGISIAGSRFEFLGFSHSSLRDQTCWFMAPFEYNDVLLDAEAVITNLGDFSTIRCPAKCAARIGQAFSNTDGAVRISPATVTEIPDIERNGRVFSDGVGTISADTLAIIWKDYTPARRSKPTLYQIRYAGAKGMISLDTRLEGEALLLRRSMIKFEGSNASDIEICGSASRPLPMYLNRQYIKIMEDLGVDPSVFVELQNAAVERLRRTTLSAINSASFLERELVGKIARVPWLIRKLHYIGFEFLEDPFLREVVELAVLSQLRDLKHRSRIPVEQGVTLYGIMDETDTLAEGEVYCHTDKKVIIGRVAVTRAPALHPGDIQVASAVDVPEDSPLNALHNCIVFSQQGQRDLPSQLSGGDLDGDTYSVIYDPRLLPPRVVAPADYPRVTPEDIGRPVTRQDITNFFINFMENDQLGRIATVHMQLADRRDGGTQHPDCITLAEMHSTAVDFSKSGIPVDMKKCPKYDLCRPDFMAPNPRVTIEKGTWILEENSPRDFAEDEDPVSALDPDAKSYRYYESEKVLGTLYRAIDEKKFLADLQRRVQEVGATNALDQSLIRRLWGYIQSQTRLIQWEHCREQAYEIKEAYETQLLNTMYQFSAHPAHLISEVEVFVGTLLGKSGGVRNHRLREMSMDMKETFERDTAFTVDCITGVSREEGGKDEALERSIACFAVAVEEARNTQEGAKTKLESFIYVAAAVCLGELERIQSIYG